MTLHEYLQGMKGKTAAVIGLGVSNRPLVELLARNGVKVIACDRKERAALGGAAAHYEALGAVLHLGEDFPIARRHLAEVGLGHTRGHFMLDPLEGITEPGHAK